MIINGNAIADEIKEELKRAVLTLPAPPRLFVFLVGGNPASKSFVARKKKFAEEIGISFSLRQFPEDVPPAEFISALDAAARDESVTGIVVQLPLPPHIDTEAALSMIPPKKDPDVLSPEAVRRFEKGESATMPPVAGAVAEILSRAGVLVSGKRAIVIGKGRLVGKPAAAWLSREGSEVAILDRSSGDLRGALVGADIIVSGAGVPGLIKPDMIKEGAILIDAGTSESEGKLKGDADPACADKCAVFTPVPGGIGPITVAVLFKNLLELTKV